MKSTLFIALLTLLMLALGMKAIAADVATIVEGDRVEIDGYWENGSLIATKLVKEKADDFPEIKGFADKVDRDSRTITIAAFTIHVPRSIDIEDNDNSKKSYKLKELKKNWRLKIEVELISQFEFKALQIDVDRAKKRTNPPKLEVEAFIDSISKNSKGEKVVSLLGVPCNLRLLLNNTGSKGTTGLPQTNQPIYVQIDDDDSRPSEQFQLFQGLTIGGEVQLDFEYKDNFNLDNHSNQDTNVLGTSTTLEALFAINPSIYAFAKVRSAKDYVISDEMRDLSLHENTSLEELHIDIQKFLVPNLSLRLGRQDFDEEREWLYDDNLDAIRLFWKAKQFELEYSWSTLLADAPRERKKLRQQFLVTRWRYARKSYGSIYVLDIQDRSSRDDSPFFVGGRIYSQSKNLIYWMECALVDGVDGTEEIQSYGLDVGLTTRLQSLPLSPYLIASYAWGSGDSKASGRTNRNFRQTSMQDNNQKYFGVASYRYYGELLRPELSNLHIYTLGIGFRPSDNSSVDLVVHNYQQDHASTVIRNSDLRSTPSGLDRDLGTEFDIIIGFSKLWGHMDMELDLSYFKPGDAFRNFDDSAFKALLQLEWNF